jgi:hypothetical protein
MVWNARSVMPGGAGGADLLQPLLSSVRSMSLLDGSAGAPPPLGMRGHYIDTKPGHRRMTAVGSNQNKAITKRLASAGHYQQVSSCFMPLSMAFRLLSQGPLQLLARRAPCGARSLMRSGA